MKRRLLIGYIILAFSGHLVAQVTADTAAVAARSPFFEPGRTLLLRNISTKPLPASFLRMSLETAECTGYPVRPFFCRIESGIEQRSHVPFRFRLGSLGYTDWLEGKASILARDR